jgi:protein gp37
MKMYEEEGVFIVQGELDIHPCALIMPPMDEETYGKFKIDISGHGLIHPIILYQGKILDGRNRYNACRELGIEIKAENWEGGSDPITYVVSNNIHRRHLSPGQRAIAAAKAINFWAEEAKERQEAGVKIDDLSAPVRQGRAADQAGEAFGVSGRSVSSAKYILDHGTEEEVTALSSGNAAIKPLEAKVRERVKETPKPKPVFNETTDSVEWARWTWNPVTGCNNGCTYCYARDIANRFFEEKFKPTFHPERLSAPQNTKLPDKKDGGNRNVFVCSMADLFGDWVPQEWIDKVLSAVVAAPQWTFIFLTKNPKRLIDTHWPDNAWVGTTVDCQARVNDAVEAFKSVDAATTFVSCEPLLERLIFPDLSCFSWVIIGGQSASSGAPASQPEWSWVEKLHNDARDANCSIYWKPNLTVRPKEYPNNG